MPKITLSVTSTDYAVKVEFFITNAIRQMVPPLIKTLDDSRKDGHPNYSTCYVTQMYMDADIDINGKSFCVEFTPGRGREEAEHIQMIAKFIFNQLLSTGFTEIEFRSSTPAPRHRMAVKFCEHIQQQIAQKLTPISTTTTTSTVTSEPIVNAQAPIVQSSETQALSAGDYRREQNHVYFDAVSNGHHVSEEEKLDLYRQIHAQLNALLENIQFGRDSESSHQDELTRLRELMATWSPDYGKPIVAPDGCYLGQLMEVFLSRYQSTPQYKTLCQLLLDGGASVAYTTHCGNTTALHLAVSHDVELVELILRQPGIEINKCNASGLSPLMVAVLPSVNPSPQIVEALIREGANVAITDNDGRTPLYYAVMHRVPSVGIIRILLQNGADMNVKDRFQLTPLEYATHSNCASILKAFKEWQHEASQPTQTNASGSNPGKSRASVFPPPPVNGPDTASAATQQQLAAPQQPVPDPGACCRVM